MRYDHQYVGTVALEEWMKRYPDFELLDPDAGPLIAVRLHILTRKSLGGIETNLQGQALAAAAQGEPQAAATSSTCTEK